MIDPNKTHRVRNALVLSINGPAGRCEFRSKGTIFHGWLDRPGCIPGDRVNLQVRFSITQDCYIVKTANLPKVRKIKITETDDGDEPSAACLEAWKKGPKALMHFSTRIWCASYSVTLEMVETTDLCAGQLLGKVQS